VILLQHVGDQLPRLTTSRGMLADDHKALNMYTAGYGSSQRQTIWKSTKAIPSNRRPEGDTKMSDVPIYMIRRVDRWASSDAGDMIQLEAATEDGSKVVLRTSYDLAARLAQAIIQAAGIAEKKQKQMPGQGIELVTPYMATDVQAGSSVDRKVVALNFQTTEGVPIQVAMPPNVARDTIARLSDELSRLELGPAQKLS
jgi:hypothetical protein